MFDLLQVHGARLSVQWGRDPGWPYWAWLPHCWQKEKICEYQTVLVLAMTSLCYKVLVSHAKLVIFLWFSFWRNLSHELWGINNLNCLELFNDLSKPCWLGWCQCNSTGWDRSHCLPALCRVWQLVKLSDASLWTFLRYSLVFDAYVKKPTKQTNKFLAKFIVAYSVS